MEKDSTASFVKSDDPTTTFDIMPSGGHLVGYVVCKSKNNRPHTMDANHITMDADGFTCVKSPVSKLYHVWHICTCPQCSELVHDAAFGDSYIGGRVFTHSQGDADSHLKYVDNKYIMTFNTPK